jgi:hypothetical protein
MLHLLIEHWMLTTLNAPQWCFTCWWILVVIWFLDVCVKLVKFGKELK